MLAWWSARDPLRPSAAARPNPHPRAAFVVLVLAIAALVGYIAREVWHPGVRTDVYALDRRLRPTCQDPTAPDCVNSGALVGTGKGAVAIAVSARPGVVDVASRAVVDFAQALVQTNVTAAFTVVAGVPPVVAVVNASGQRTWVRLTPSFAGPAPLRDFPPVVLYVDASDPAVRATGCWPEAGGGTGGAAAVATPSPVARCAVVGAQSHPGADLQRCGMLMRMRWQRSQHMVVATSQLAGGCLTDNVAVDSGGWLVGGATAHLSVAANLATPLQQGGYTAHELDGYSTYDAPSPLLPTPHNAPQNSGGLGQPSQHAAPARAAGATAAAAQRLVPVLRFQLAPTVQLWLTVPATPTTGVRLLVFVGAALLSLFAALKRGLVMVSAATRGMQRARLPCGCSGASVATVASGAVVCAAGVASLVALLCALADLVTMYQAWPPAGHPYAPRPQHTALLFAHYARWLLAAAAATAAGAFVTSPACSCVVSRTSRGRAVHVSAGRGGAPTAWLASACVRVGWCLLLPDASALSLLALVQVRGTPGSLSSPVSRVVQCACVTALLAVFRWLEWFPRSVFWHPSRSSRNRGAGTPPGVHTGVGGGVIAANAGHSGSGRRHAGGVNGGGSVAHGRSKLRACSGRYLRHCNGPPAGARWVIRLTCTLTLACGSGWMAWMWHMSGAAASSAPFTLAKPLLSAATMARLYLFGAAVCTTTVVAGGVAACARGGQHVRPTMPAQPSPARTRVRARGCGPAHQVAATLGILCMSVAALAFVDLASFGGPAAMTGVDTIVATALGLYAMAACWALWEVAAVEGADSCGGTRTGNAQPGSVRSTMTAAAASAAARYLAQDLELQRCTDGSRAHAKAGGPCSMSQPLLGGGARARGHREHTVARDPDSVARSPVETGGVALRGQVAGGDAAAHVVPAAPAPQVTPRPPPRVAPGVAVNVVGAVLAAMGCAASAYGLVALNGPALGFWTAG